MFRYDPHYTPIKFPISETLPTVCITLSLPCEEQKRQNSPVKYYWEIIADNLSKRGWSWGCVSALDREGRTICIVDAHRDDGRRFVVHADEKLTAFVELECAIHQSWQGIARSPILE
jgi:hypothetical protein